MFLIAVVSIVTGMSKYVEEDFAGRMLGANTFTLRRFPWFGNNVTEDEWREWQRRPRVYHSDVAIIRDALPGGTRYAVESQENLSASSKYARPRTLEAHAVEGDYFTIKKLDLSDGRVFSPQEGEMGAPVMLVGDEVAKYFFEGLNPIGRELRVGGIPYTVIGVIAHQGSLFGHSLDETAFAPFNSPLHRLTNPRGDIDGLMVQAPSAVMMDEAMETVREVMRGHRRLRPGTPDNFVMETSASALTSFEKTKTIMTIAGTALPAISLVVGGLVIMNIMLVSVRERTREIGIRKAIGARRRDVLAQFLVEAVVLSVLGGMLGVALGALASFVIGQVAGWGFVFSLPTVAIALGFSALIGIVFGVWPARQAAVLDPIVALRYE